MDGNNANKRSASALDANNLSEKDIKMLKKKNVMLQASFEMMEVFFGKLKLTIDDGENRYLLFEKITRKKRTTVTIKIPLLKNGRLQNVEFPVHNFTQIHHTSTENPNGVFEFILEASQEGINYFKIFFPEVVEEAFAIHENEGALPPTYFRIICNSDAFWIWINKKEAETLDCSEKMGTFTEIFASHMNSHCVDQGIDRGNWNPLGLLHDPQNALELLDYGRNLQGIAEDQQNDDQIDVEEIREEDFDNIQVEVQRPAQKRKNTTAQGRRQSGRGGRLQRGRHTYNDVIERNENKEVLAQIDGDQEEESEPEDEQMNHEMESQPCTSASLYKKKKKVVPPSNQIYHNTTPLPSQIAPLNSPSLAHFAASGKLIDVPEPNEKDFQHVIQQQQQQKAKQHPVLDISEMQQDATIQELQEMIVNASRAVAERRFVEDAVRQVDNAVHEVQLDLGEHLDEDEHGQEESEDEELNEQDDQELGESQNARMEGEVSIDNAAQDDYEIFVARDEQGSARISDSHEAINEMNVQKTPAENEKKAEKEKIANTEDEPHNKEIVPVSSNELHKQEVISSHKGADSIEQEGLTDDLQKHQVCGNMKGAQKKEDDVSHEKPNAGENARVFSKDPTEDAEKVIDLKGIPRISEEEGTPHTTLISRKRALELERAELEVKLAESKLQNAKKERKNLDLKYENDKELADIEIQTKEVELELARARAKIGQQNIFK